MLKIALDLDDTVFEWRKTHETKFHVKISRTKSEVISQQVNTLKYDKDFWSNLPLLEKPDFTPEVWCTKRINPKSYTKISLKKNDLPVKPIIQLYNQQDNKATKLTGVVDVLIDDSWFNVNQCLLAGFPALLITRPHNKWIKTPYRVSHLKYNEIVEVYNELFR